jgi:hypothetical protein
MPRLPDGRCQLYGQSSARYRTSGGATSAAAKNLTSAVFETEQDCPSACHCSSYQKFLCSDPCYLGSCVVFVIFVYALTDGFELICTLESAESDLR